MSIDYLELLKVFGLPVALLAYYIWMEHNDKKLRTIRENELIRRVETLEIAHRETLTATENKVTKLFRHVGADADFRGFGLAVFPAHGWLARDRLRSALAGPACPRRTPGGMPITPRPMPLAISEEARRSGWALN